MDITATPNGEVLPAIGSTDPQDFLDMRAEHRARQLRSTRRKRVGLVVAALALLTGTAAWRVATARSTVAATPDPLELVPVATPAVVAPPVAAPEPVAAVVAPAAASAEETARCDRAFGDKHWRIAVEACTAVFAAAPSHDVAMKLAHAQWSRGQRAEAGVWAAKALELGTEDVDAYVLVGHAERRAGRTAEAVRAYQAYLERAPRGWHAATVRQALGQMDSAR